MSHLRHCKKNRILSQVRHSLVFRRVSQVRHYPYGHSGLSLPWCGLTNLPMDFEAWAARNGLLDEIHRLEAKGFMERRRRRDGTDAVARVTEAGFEALRTGKDPEALWNLKWDGLWRLFLFDLPADDYKTRKRFLRALRGCGCGCPQGSVWICCRLPPGMKPVLNDRETNPGALVVMEARRKGGGGGRRPGFFHWMSQSGHSTWWRRRRREGRISGRFGLKCPGNVARQA